jgi:hypothetical protein
MPQIFSIASTDLDHAWVVPRYQTKQVVQSIVNSLRLNVRPLSDVAAISSGIYMRHYAAEGVPYLRVDNIRRLVMNCTREDLVFVSKEEVERYIPERCRGRKQDILVARTGTLGKATLVTDMFDGCVLSQHVSKITVASRDFISPACLCLYLNSELGTGQLIDSGMGSTRPELTHLALSSLAVPAIPVDVQQCFNARLQRALGDYGLLTEQLASLIREANQVLGIPESMTDDNVTDNGALGPKIVTLESSELEDIWLPNRYSAVVRSALDHIKSRFNVIRLEELTDIKRGKGTRISQYRRAGVPFLRTSSLINQSIEPLPEHYAESSVDNGVNEVIKDGDIIFSIEGKIGQVALLSSELRLLALKNHIELVRLKNRGYPPYQQPELTGWVYLVLASSLGKIQCIGNTVVQSTIPGLASRLRQFYIPLPRDSARITQQLRRLGTAAYETSRRVLGVILILQRIQEDFNMMMDGLIERKGAQT